MRKHGEPEVLPSGYEDQVYECKHCGYCWVKSEYVGGARKLDLTRLPMFGGSDET